MRGGKRHSCVDGREGRAGGCDMDYETVPEIVAGEVGEDAVDGGGVGMDVGCAADGEDGVGGAKGWGAKDTRETGEGCVFEMGRDGVGRGEEGEEEGDEVVEAHFGRVALVYG